MARHHRDGWGIPPRTPQPAPSPTPHPVQPAPSKGGK